MLHPCAALEGRANLHDGPASTTCDAATSCDRYYYRTGSTFHLCELQTDGSCADGPPLSCGVSSALPRLRALRLLLANSTDTATDSEAAAVVATAEVFESGIARDAELSRDQLTAMLNYQIIYGTLIDRMGGSRLHDRADCGPFSVRSDRLAREDSSCGATAGAATAAASKFIMGVCGFVWCRRLALRRLPTLSLSPPLHLMFNSVGNLISRQRTTRTWRMDRGGARRLRALGTNTIVLFASPAVMLSPTYDNSNASSSAALYNEPLNKLLDQIESVSSEGFSHTRTVCTTLLATHDLMD